MLPNPLIGPNLEEFGTRFPDMTCAYDLNLQTVAERILTEMGITPKKGVYFASSGPTYETPAEVRFFRTIGADLVGMSTVPEVISAVHSGIDVLGFSIITNMGTGLQEQTQSHEETLSMAAKSTENLAILINNIFERI
jgi:purine-nucleoside phosphorylase